MINTELNKKDIDALSELSDEALREKILSAVSSCGIDRGAAARRLPDIKLIRKKLSSLSDKDIKTLSAVLGEENLGSFRGGLKDGSKQ